MFVTVSTKPSTDRYPELDNLAVILFFFFVTVTFTAYSTPHRLYLSLRLSSISSTRATRSALCPWFLYTGRVDQNRMSAFRKPHENSESRQKTTRLWEYCCHSVRSGCYQWMLQVGNTTACILWTRRGRKMAFVTGKVKFTLEQVLKAQRGKALLFP
jgi:hypothetical protein